MRSRSKKNRMIIFLCVALVFMGIGYATLQSNLSISGSASAAGTFDVQITNVEENQESSSRGGVSANKKSGTYTAKTATISAEFSKPGDFVIYQVDVTNLGSIDAVIDVAVDNEVLASQEDGYGNKIYLLSVKTSDGKNATSVRQDLDVNDTKSIMVKIAFNESARILPQNSEVTFTVSVIAMQKSSSLLPPAPEPDLGPDYSVDNSGLVTGYNPSKVQYDQDGYLVVPAVNEEGQQIKYINNSSLAQKNASFAQVMNGETEELLFGVIIYDEDNFEAIKSVVERYLSGEDDSEPEGTNNVFGKDFSPSKLLNNKKIGTIIRVEDLSGIGIYTLSEFNELKTAMDNGNLMEYYMGLYVDVENGIIGNACRETKIDFSNATNLIEIVDYAFQDGSIVGIRLPQNGSLTTIGDGAFQNNQISGALTMPSSVTSIGEQAFENNHISSLDLSNATRLQTIGSNAFSDNQITGTLIIPSSVTTLGRYTFYGNQISTLNLTNATGLGSIDSYVFSENQITGTVTIPANVTIVGECAFYNNLIGTLNFSNATGLQSIGYHAFGENQISSLDLSNATSLQTIEDGAFSENQISTMIIPNSVTSMGSSAFDSDITIQTLTIDMPTISDSLFRDVSIQSLTIGTHVQTIGEDAFLGCGISTLNISNATSLQTIGAYAFQNNQISGTLTIPSSVTSIGERTFLGGYGDNQISALDLSNATSLETIGEAAFAGNPISGTLTIPSSVTTIGGSAFKDIQISTLNLSNASSLEIIGHFAFYGNQLSGTLTIPSSVTSIGNDAFSSYSASDVEPTNRISGLVFASGSHLRTIGNSAFSDNQLSGTLTIPSSVTSIGERAFDENQISTLDLSNATSLTAIGSYAFTYNQLSGTLTIPSSVTSIGNGAFFGSSNGNQISTLDLNNATSLETIGDYAFYNNQISGTITIPSSVTSIGARAFYVNHIEILNLGSGLQYIGDYSFSSNFLTELNINMTQNTWSSRNLPTTTGGWYDGTPTVTYAS